MKHKLMCFLIWVFLFIVIHCSQYQKLRPNELRSMKQNIVEQNGQQVKQVKKVQQVQKVQKPSQTKHRLLNSFLRQIQQKNRQYLRTKQQIQQKSSLSLQNLTTIKQDPLLQNSNNTNTKTQLPTKKIDKKPINKNMNTNKTRFLVNQKSILYISQQEKDSSYSIGLQQQLNKIQLFQFEKIKLNQLKQISQGYFGVIYVWKHNDWIVKLYRSQTMFRIQDQLQSLLNINKGVYPQFLKKVIVIGTQIIGFIQQYVKGQFPFKLYKRENNVFYGNVSARWELVKKIRNQVRKFQENRIVHGDLQMQNMLVDQRDSQSVELVVKIIDFSNTFKFTYDQLSYHRITSRGNLRPSQSKVKKGTLYNSTGVNAFQFGYTALLILLKKSRDTDTIKNFTQQFQSLRRMGLQQNVINYFQVLLGDNIQNRNKALFSEPQALDVKGSLSDKIFIRHDKNIQEKKQQKHENNISKDEDCKQLFDQQFQ